MKNAIYAALGLLMMVVPVAASETPATISVSARGEVTAVPDMATITLGVTSTNADAAKAMDETSAKVAAILSTLRDAGLQDKDLRTRGIDLRPIWANRTSSANREPEIQGFVASNTLSVRVRNLDLLGHVMGLVLRDGANTFSGLNFGVQDSAPLLEAARRNAVEQARARADLYANAAGVELGPLLSLSEGGGGYQPAPRFAMAADFAEAAVPVAEGELTFGVTVNMVYEIAQ